jgi:ubiquinone/menaquinone biosynthesis C-methylase UbiE
LVRGCIDILNHQSVVGWVAGEKGEASGQRFVRVIIDGTEIGTCRANFFRPDLRDVGISDGFSGYRFYFPQVPDPFIDHVVELFDRDSGTPLTPYPSTLRALTENSKESMLEFDPQIVTSHIRTAEFRAGTWHVSVELVGPPNLNLKPSVRNGIILKSSEGATGSSNAFLTAGLRQQSVTLQIKSTPGAEVIFLELLENPAEAGKYEPVTHITLPAEIPDDLKNLTQENMARVSGPQVTVDLYAASGVNTAFRINALMRHHFGKSFDQVDFIHDWGIGSGRVALPLKSFIAPRSKLSGSDVDGLNVEFGNANHPRIEFTVGPFYPPLPYPDESFDSLYGISVMTHLTEGAQFAWLKELRRVVRPGAAVILTVHGEYGILNAAAHDSKVLIDTWSRGISDYMPDMNLGPKLSDRNYYRASFHTRKYVAEQWTQYFDVLGHYSCANVIVQDFVVLRAK